MANETKREFYAALDNHQTPLDSSEAREMNELLMEVADLGVPDPGTDYWMNFNARLQARLSTRSRSRSLFAFMRWPALAMVVAALLLWVYIPRDSVDQPALENLSEDNLTMLSHLFDDYESDDYEQADEAYVFESDSDDYDLLIQALSDSSSPEELLLDGMMADELETLRSTWNMEG